MSDVLEALRRLATETIAAGVWELGGPDIATYAERRRVATRIRRGRDRSILSGRAARS